VTSDRRPNMPTFDYIAIDTTGARVTGRLTDTDEQAATQRLRESGSFPTAIRLAGEGPLSAPRLATRVKSADLTIFSRQLANLVKGGLPLLRAFSALIEHTDNPNLRQVLTEVRSEIQSGTTLSDALAGHPGAFPPLYVNMVRAGEESGDLQGVLAWLASLLERDNIQRSQIRSALAYPLLLLTVGSAAVTCLLIFLIPRFVDIFAELEQALPLPTQILLNVSSGLAKWWWAIGGGIALLWTAAKQYVGSPSGRLAWDRFRLRLPLLGPLTRKIVVARLSRTLSTLLRGGVPILSAMEVVREVLGNEVLARGVDEVRLKVKEGESIAGPLAQEGVFPPLLTHMIALGEETGDLPGVLDTVANSYDVEVENEMKAVISLIEPLIILVMGTLIAFIILAMLLPIFQMNVFQAG